MNREAKLSGLGALWLIFSFSSVALAQKGMNILYLGGECSTHGWYWSDTKDSAGRLSQNSAYAFFDGKYKLLDNTPLVQMLDPYMRAGGGWSAYALPIPAIDGTMDNSSDIWSSVAQMAERLNNSCGISPHSYTYYGQGACTKTIVYDGKLVCAQHASVAYTAIAPPAECVIFTYSGGDNILRKLLSMYDDLWDIKMIYVIAGAGGGSELASARYYGSYPGLDISRLSDAPRPLPAPDAPPIAECRFQQYMDVDTVRSGYGAGWWAYDDTNGRPFYHWASPNFEARDGTSPDGQPSDVYSELLPGNDDGAVAFHSSLGRAFVDAYTMDDPGNDYDDNYYGHYVINPDFVPRDVYLGWYARNNQHWLAKLGGMNYIGRVSSENDFYYYDDAFCHYLPGCGSPYGDSYGPSIPWIQDVYIECSGQTSLGPHQHCL